MPLAKSCRVVLVHRLPRLPRIVIYQVQGDLLSKFHGTPAYRDVWKRRKIGMGMIRKEHFAQGDDVGLQLAGAPQAAHGVASGERTAARWSPGRSRASRSTPPSSGRSPKRQWRSACSPTIETCAPGRTYPSVSGPAGPRRPWLPSADRPGATRRRRGASSRGAKNHRRVLLQLRKEREPIAVVQPVRR